MGAWERAWARFPPDNPAARGGRVGRAAVAMQRERIDSERWLCCTYPQFQDTTFALSWFVQVAVLILSVVALCFPATELLRVILWLELIVQIVEFVWYTAIGIRYQFQGKSTGVSARYIDWVFTTPVMLCSIFLALAYFANPCTRSADVASEYWWVFLVLVLSDWAMLVFGWLVESGRFWRSRPERDRALFMALGFVPLCIPFVLMLCIERLEWETEEGLWLLILTWVLWAGYGVVALFLVRPPVAAAGAPTSVADCDECVKRDQLKNAWYNVLDMVSKNLMGFIIAIVALNAAGEGIGADENCAPPSAPPVAAMG